MSLPQSCKPIAQCGDISKHGFREFSPKTAGLHVDQGFICDEVPVNGACKEYTCDDNSQSGREVTSDMIMSVPPGVCLHAPNREDFLEEADLEPDDWSEDIMGALAQVASWFLSVIMPVGPGRPTFLTARPCSCCHLSRSAWAMRIPAENTAEPEGQGARHTQPTPLTPHTPLPERPATSHSENAL